MEKTPAMNITFAQDSILASLIIDTSNDEHLYRTYCTDSTHGRSTTLERSMYDDHDKDKDQGQGQDKDKDKDKDKVFMEPEGWMPIAIIDWHPTWILSSLVTVAYRGNTRMRLSINDLLEWPSATESQSQWENSARVFVAQNGLRYKWDKGRGIWGDFTMTNAQTNEIVVLSHSRKLTFFGQSKRLNLDVAEEGVPILDDIVLTFILFSQQASGY